MGKELKSVKEHNDQRHKEIEEENATVGSGFACPNCEGELVDLSPHEILASIPPKKKLYCPNCKIHEYVIV